MKMTTTDLTYLFELAVTERARHVHLRILQINPPVGMFTRLRESLGLVSESEPKELCWRTLCKYLPGITFEGVGHQYRYVGEMPGTGPRECQTCGKTEPNKEE